MPWSLFTSQCTSSKSASHPWLSVLSSKFFHCSPRSQRGATIIGMLLLLPFTLIRRLKFPPAAVFVEDSSWLSKGLALYEAIAVWNLGLDCAKKMPIINFGIKKWTMAMLWFFSILCFALLSAADLKQSKGRSNVLQSFQQWLRLSEAEQLHGISSVYGKYFLQYHAE